MMKKTVYCLLIMLVILSGCSPDRITADIDTASLTADLVLMDKDNYYLCNIDDSIDEIKLAQTIKSPKNKKELGYLTDFTFADTNRYYLKTQTNSKLETFLQTVSKDDLQIKSITLDNDFYSNYMYNEKIYAVSSFANDTAYIVMDVYNSDLSLQYSKQFEHSAVLMFPSGIEVDDEKIYLVCGIVEQDAEYGDVKVYLFEFDLDFNLLNSTDLQLYDGGYQSVAKVGEVLYLAKTTQGLDDNGYAQGSQYIDKYDLNTKVMENNAIELKYPYPIHIRYDDKNEKLVIQHEKNSLGKNCYSIYNLKDNTVDTLLFDEKIYGNNYIYYIQNDDKYYFQTSEGLGIYEVENKRINQYNLKKLNLNLLNGIFFLK